MEQSFFYNLQLNLFLKQLFTRHMIRLSIHLPIHSSINQSIPYPTHRRHSPTPTRPCACLPKYRIDVEIASNAMARLMQPVIVCTTMNGYLCTISRSHRFILTRFFQRFFTYFASIQTHKHSLMQSFNNSYLIRSQFIFTPTLSFRSISVWLQTMELYINLLFL